MDYIDFTHPGLKDQLSNLSLLLLCIVYYRILPPQRLVLETLPSSHLSEVGNRPLEELLQYCAEDQNAIEPAQGTVLDFAPEDLGQLSFPFDRFDSGTLSNSAMDINEYVHASPPVLWAGDCEFSLNTAATEARNNLMVNSRIEECHLPRASRLDNEFLLSPTVIYQGILSKFELLVG